MLLCQEERASSDINFQAFEDAEQWGKLHTMVYKNHGTQSYL